MNHLEYSQQVRAEIEKSLLYDKLKSHFAGQNRFTYCLGEGEHFRHLRTERLGSDIYVAIKQPLQNPENPKSLEEHCQATYAFARLFHQEWHKKIHHVLHVPMLYAAVTSAFCIGVKYRTKQDTWHHALLVEDLASLGIPIHKEAASEDSGTIRVYDRSIKVYFDIGQQLEELALAPAVGGKQNIPKYMEDNKMITFW